MSLESMITADKAPTVEEVAEAMAQAAQAIAEAHGKPMVATGQKTPEAHAKRLIRRACAHLHKGTPFADYLLAFDAAESAQMKMTGYAEQHAETIEGKVSDMATAHSKIVETLEAAAEELRWQ
jgi:thiamine pyrophosphate-dependent acetolactate synthase large subunit-like protein